MPRFVKMVKVENLTPEQKEDMMRIYSFARGKNIDLYLFGMNIYNGKLYYAAKHNNKNGYLMVDNKEVYFIQNDGLRNGTIHRG
jgi:hypothetical protein